jgi:hypothetical protein
MTTAQQFANECLEKFQLARDLGVNAEMVKALGGGVLDLSVKSNGLTVQFANSYDGNGLACTIYHGSAPHCFGERTAPDAYLAYMGLCQKSPTKVSE